jgi:hypothetical protein
MIGLSGKGGKDWLGPTSSITERPIFHTSFPDFFSSPTD